MVTWGRDGGTREHLLVLNEQIRFLGRVATTSWFRTLLGEDVPDTVLHTASELHGAATVLQLDDTMILCPNHVSGGRHIDSARIMEDTHLYVTQTMTPGDEVTVRMIRRRTGQNPTIALLASILDTLVELGHLQARGRVWIRT